MTLDDVERQPKMSRSSRGNGKQGQSRRIVVSREKGVLFEWVCSYVQLRVDPDGDGHVLIARWLAQPRKLAPGRSQQKIRSGWNQRNFILRRTYRKLPSAPAAHWKEGRSWA